MLGHRTGHQAEDGLANPCAGIHRLPGGQTGRGFIECKSVDSRMSRATLAATVDRRGDHACGVSLERDATRFDRMSQLRLGVKLFRTAG
jgi:hypothetical protein